MQRRESNKKLQEVVYGQATFQKRILQKNIQLQKIHFSTLRQIKWIVKQKDYQKYNWQQVFQNMVLCQALEIKLQNNKHSAILKQISNTVYINLKTLCLFDNNIHSIEPLSWLNCLSLQNLHLSYNNIVQINCFKKLLLSSLQQLYLYFNPIFEANILIKSNLHNNKIKSIYLEFSKNQFLISQDLSFLVKLQPHSIQQIKVKSKMRIFQKKLLTLLKQRYYSIDFQYYRQHQLQQMSA